MSTQAKREVTVEEALKELAVMLPDRKFNASRVETGWNDGRTKNRAEIVVYGGTSAGGAFAANTLTDCLAQVRKWKERQR